MKITPFSIHVSEDGEVKLPLRRGMDVGSPDHAVMLDCLKYVRNRVADAEEGPGRPSAKGPAAESKGA